MAKNIVPTRMCSSCMTRRPKNELLRVVRGLDGVILVDRTHKAPGRGAYVCCDTACISAAEKKNRFARTLKTQIPPEIYRELTALADEE